MKRFRTMCFVLIGTLLGVAILSIAFYLRTNDGGYLFIASVTAIIGFIAAFGIDKVEEKAKAEAETDKEES